MKQRFVDHCVVLRSPKFGSSKTYVAEFVSLTELRTIPFPAGSLENAKQVVEARVSGMGGIHFEWKPLDSQHDCYDRQRDGLDFALTFDLPQDTAVSA